MIYGEGRFHPNEDTWTVGELISGLKEFQDRFGDVQVRVSVYDYAIADDVLEPLEFYFDDVKKVLVIY